MQGWRLLLLFLWSSVAFQEHWSWAAKDLNVFDLAFFKLLLLIEPFRDLRPNRLTAVLRLLWAASLSLLLLLFIPLPISWPRTLAFFNKLFEAFIFLQLGILDIPEASSCQQGILMKWSRVKLLSLTFKEKHHTFSLWRLWPVPNLRGLLGLDFLEPDQPSVLT